jgi:ABC-type sugar transport system ATPase subunit
VVQVVVRNVSKSFGRKMPHLALSNISITAEDGEFLVLLGPSGSGKTTLLRAIAGLEQVDAGEIEIGGRKVNDVDPGRRNVGMVFQDYALYPHLSVRQNISYNMKLRRVARADIERRVGEVARMLGIGELLVRRPAELSGGQRQRVAVARAITRDASVLLMDEPLSNLDAQIREHVRVEIRELQRRIGVTTIYVTHDQVEAMVLADRIAVMANGAIEQIGTAENVYSRPATLFCARFVGSPKVNEIAGSLERTETRTAIFSIAADSGERPLALQLELESAPTHPAAENCVLVFRPED